MSRPVPGAFRASLCVTLLAVGCGGRTTGGGGASGSASGMGVASGGSGASADMDATPEGGSCSIRAADYDQSCTSDSDCVGVHEGTSCACTNCINAAIGTTSESEYNSAFVRAFPNSGDCPCAAPPPAYCNNGDCAVCLSGSCGQPPSCATGGPGMTNCGPGGSGTESCCTSLEVTGGTYYRTYDLDSNGNAVLVPDGGPTGEADPATVSTLRLDKYEVTVGRFRQFVTAWSTGWLPAAGSGKHTHVNSGNGLNATGGGYEPGWGAPDDVWIAPTSANLASAPGQGGGGCDGPGTWTPSVGSNENLPINCENWYEAYAFCIWDGGFLPSEAEWEYAAAGGSQQREYPWGSTDPGTSNQYAIYGCYFPSGSVTCRSPTSIAPVGTAALGAGLWGQLDLAGNVFEWNLDGAASLLPLYVDPCTDCAYLISTGTRDRRGGSWVLWPPPTHDLVPSYPGGADPNGRDFGSGFRCARTP